MRGGQRSSLLYTQVSSWLQAESFPGPDIKVTMGAYLNVTHIELNRLFDDFRKRRDLSAPEHRDRLFNEFLSFLQRNQINVKQPVVDKPCKATLVHWQIHQMTSVPTRSLQAHIHGLLDPQIKISGTYENTVYHTHTSPLISFHFNENKQEGIVETAYSIYKLKGPEGDPVTGSRDIGELVDLIAYEQQCSQDVYHRDQERHVVARPFGRATG